MTTVDEELSSDELHEIERLATAAADNGICLVPLSFRFRYPNDYDSRRPTQQRPSWRALNVFGELNDVDAWPYLVSVENVNSTKLLGHKSDESSFLMVAVCPHSAVDLLAKFVERKLVVGENECTAFSGEYPGIAISLCKKGDAVCKQEDISRVLTTLLANWQDNAYEMATICLEEPLTNESIDRTLKILNNANWHAGAAINIASRTLAARQKCVEGTRFLVPGLIPKNAITLLAAKTKHGKSTLALELAGVVGQGGGAWCGFQIPEKECEGVPLFLSGEDSESVLIDRIQRMGLGLNTLLQIIPTFGAEQLREVLASYESARVSSVTVDPARSFFSGDEDGSDKVSSELFQQLERFAQKKNCAVVVSHHLKKDANPRNLEEVARAIRGSSVFIDRPRAIIALLRQSDQSLLGIPSISGIPLCNFQNLMFTGERRLRFDSATDRHSPIDSGTTRTQAAHLATPDDTAAVAKAILRLESEGVKITKSGTHGVFERRLPEIEGTSRIRVRAAIDQLLAEELLVQGADGSLKAKDMLESRYGRNRDCLVADPLPSP